MPKSEYGEQLWDRQSINRNEDGSVRVLSKFIPKTKSEITRDILYTMDINCFEKSFRTRYFFVFFYNLKFLVFDSADLTNNTQNQGISIWILPIS